MTRFKILLFLLLIFYSSPAFCQLPTYALTPESENLIDFEMFYFLDESGEMTVQQVTSLEAEGRFGPSRVVLPASPANNWAGFRLENISEEPVARLIGFDEPHLVNADLYTRSNGGWQEMRNGLTVPYSERPYASRLPVFKVVLAPGESRDFYLMFNTAYPMTTVGIHVQKEQDFSWHQLQQIIFSSLYLGALGAIVLYNLFLLFSLKEKLHFYYVAQGFLFSLFVYSYSGLVIYTGIDAVNFNRFGAATTASQAFFLLFTRELLKTKARIPRFDKAILTLIVIISVLAVFVFLDTVYYQYIVMLSMPLMIMQLGLGIHAYVKRVDMAKFYILGTGWYILGVMVLAAVNQGFLQYTLLTRFGFLLGSLAEMIIFSLALAYRIKLLQNQKNSYQQELLAKQETETERLGHLVAKRTAELETANRELEALAQKDGLTGLFNRRYFDQVFLREHQNAMRRSTPLSLIMSDIDYFKNYNDSQGHQAGDACLRRVAELFKSQIKRATDVIARYGGEEFVVLLPDTALQQAAELAERIREAMGGSGLEHPASPLGRVSMSFGVACTGESGPDAKSPADLLALADKMLYQSKEQGRNRVTVAAD